MPGGGSRLGYWQLMDLKPRVPTIFICSLSKLHQIPWLVSFFSAGTRPSCELGNAASIPRTGRCPCAKLRLRGVRAV